MSADTEAVVLDALRRVVRQAFRPAPARHRRSAFAGSPCDVTCRACALAQARQALDRAESERAAQSM